MEIKSPAGGGTKDITRCAANCAGPPLMTGSPGTARATAPVKNLYGVRCVLECLAPGKERGRVRLLGEFDVNRGDEVAHIKRLDRGVTSTVRRSSARLP